MTKFPRVLVEIDLGDGPIQTSFRLTNYAVAFLKDELGEKGFGLLQDPEAQKKLTNTERLAMDATLMCALLLHAHDGLTIRQVLHNFPVDPGEYRQLAAKAVEAMTNHQPPANPTQGPAKKSAPKKRRARGGTEKANGVASSALN